MTLLRSSTSLRSAQDDTTEKHEAKPSGISERLRRGDLRSSALGERQILSLPLGGKCGICRKRQATDEVLVFGVSITFI